MRFTERKDLTPTQRRRRFITPMVGGSANITKVILSEPTTGDPGLAGSATTECSWRYKMVDGRDETTVLSENIALQTGCGHRLPKGPMTRATAGLGQKIDGAWQLIDAYEEPQMSACTVVETSVQTSNYNAAASETVLYNASGGAFSVFLPATPTNDDIVRIQNVVSSTNNLTLNGNGNNINGAGTKVVATGYALTSVKFYSGYGWLVQ